MRNICKKKGFAKIHDDIANILNLAMRKKL